MIILVGCDGPLPPDLEGLLQLRGGSNLSLVEGGLWAREGGRREKGREEGGVYAGLAGQCISKVIPSNGGTHLL